MKKSKAIKDTMTTTIMDMCEDLLAEILAWLPVFSLLRCTAVCTSWFILINNPTFIAKHLQVSNSTNPNILTKAPDYYYVASLKTLELVRNPLPNIQFPLPDLIGSSNGLVCLFEHGEGVIWNPATRETKVMPPCSVQKSTAQAAAFGFDAINNDYKVCVIHLFGTDYYPEPVWFKLEVYSLRTDSWNLITGSDELQIDLFYIDEWVGVYNNGVFSWVAFAHKRNLLSEYGISWKHSIISFHIDTEVITSTPLPSDIGVHEPMLYYNYIGVLDGVVSVLNDMRHPEGEDHFERYFDFWRLHEIGNEGSWEKYWSPNSPLQWWTITWIYWNDNLVFMRRNDDNLCLFRAANEEEIVIEIPRVLYLSTHFVLYSESLVKIN